jgi:ferric-dicitrate binding protein FerR (iron transport regulator)
VSDYLFDKSGPPDPEVERLEQLLAPMAYRGKVGPGLVPGRRRTPVWIAGTVLAAAAVILLLVRPWKPAPPSWAVGGWIDTGSRSLTLEVPPIGRVELAPMTRARVVATGPQDRLRVERGTASARITAPPRRFAVETPHAVITDLGCAFEVTVDETGAAHVKVTEGSVGIAEDGGPETVTAAGAVWPTPKVEEVPQAPHPVIDEKPHEKPPHVKHPGKHPVKSPALPPHVPTAPPAAQKPAPATKKADDRFSHDPWKNQTP